MIIGVNVSVSLRTKGWTVVPLNPEYRGMSGEGDTISAAMMDLRWQLISTGPVGAEYEIRVVP